MTSKQTIIKAITLLKTNYQNALKDTSEENLTALIELWADAFKDTSEVDFTRAIKNIINKQEYFPTVAQIKKEIANNQISNIPPAEDEWNEVLRVVHKYGTYRQQEALEKLKPYTAYITTHIGYQNICMSEDNTWNRKEFIAEYEQMKEKEKDLLLTGETHNLKMIPSIKLLEE